MCNHPLLQAVMSVELPQIFKTLISFINRFILLLIKGGDLISQVGHLALWEVLSQQGLGEPITW